MRALILGLLLAVTTAAPAAWAKGKGAKPPSDAGNHHGSTYAHGAPRDAHGRVARDPRARNAFKRTNPCPSTGKSTGSCPGYVIDHVQPLKRGGADTPSNMQWQNEGAAKLKDRTE